MHKPTISILIVCFFIQGCGLGLVADRRSLSKLSEIEIGMSKADIKDKLGNPDEIRKASTNENGQRIDTLQYKLKSISTDQALGNFLIGGFWTITWWFPLFKTQQDYWFDFQNDKFGKWGRIDDFTQVDKDIRFRIKDEN